MGAESRGAPFPTTMPVCVAHGTPRVVEYFLRVVQIDSALDIAG